MACNLKCPFCFSKSSISTLSRDQADWRRIDLPGYFAFARDRGATRLVITGGGEPLLRPDDVVYLVSQGARAFKEIACFTNGSYLNRHLAGRLADAGLSYLCYSRHADHDDVCKRLMGPSAPSLDEFFDAAAGLKVRATCVMAAGFIDSRQSVRRYMRKLECYGVTEFTFKHTYVAYDRSVFRNTAEDTWARCRQIEYDPFDGEGEIIARLPWGPAIRKLEGAQVCYYREPTPDWELQNRICRSTNLLSDGAVYASLEDQRSLLFRLSSSPPRSAKMKSKP